TGSFQDKKIKGSQCPHLKPKRFGTVGQGIGKVSSCPVQDGHKIITYRKNSRLGEVLNTALIIFYKNPKLAPSCFYVLMDRDAFHDRPGQSSLLDHVFSGHYGLRSPNFPVWNIVQGSDDSCRASLSDVRKAYRIFWTIPSHGWFHFYFVVHHTPEYALNPPSTGMIVPVTNFEASLQSH